MILEVDDVEFEGRAYCALIQIRPANPDGAADEREPSLEVVDLWIDRPPYNWDEIDPEENKQAADACIDEFRERNADHCE